MPELARAGLLDLRGRRGFLGRFHQVDWGAVVVIVLLIPTRPGELTFPFPAVLGSGAADDSRKGHGRDPETARERLAAEAPNARLVTYGQGDLGCTDQHSPHPPLGADWMAVRRQG